MSTPNTTLYGQKYPPHELHPRVGDFSLQETEDKGIALTCHKKFVEGELMARFDGATTSKLTQHTLQMREGEFILDIDFIGMLAHSCEPNVRLDMENHFMYALKEIWPGEVLSMDYASTEKELYRCFECACGTPSCRGYITGYGQERPDRPVMQAVPVDTERKDYRCIERNSIRYYGQHMMVSAYGCSDDLLSVEQMSTFLSELADAIDMVRFGPAHVHRFGNGNEIGLSGFQLIETSQVSFHSNDGAKDMYLDVFSCKEFSEDDVIAFVKMWLAPKSLDTQTYWRK